MIIAAAVSGHPGRLWLSGILRYMAEKQVRWNWRLLRNESDLTREGLRCALDDRIDGFILASPRAADVVTGLKNGRYPIVITGIHDISEFQRRRKNVTMIGADNRAIGKMAAEHLTWASSFRSFAFIGPRAKRPWAELRREGFVKQLGVRGLTCFEYGRIDDGPGQERLKAFIRSLPKPAGVFASHDDRALEIAGLCRELGVPIPGQVALIGVDDDPVVCESGGMSLTSIDQDCEQVGYQAASILDGIMSRRGRCCREQVISSGIPRLVPRHSTEPDSRQASLVQNALAVIHREVLDGLSVSDLASRMGVSRRLLDMRFRDLQGQSVSALMKELRLKEARRLLAQTKEPIERIPLRCGYSGNCSLKRAFKAAYGVTMREFRKKSKPLSSCVA